MAKLEGDIRKLAAAVIEVSKTANTAIEQVGQIGQALNQLVPAVQQLVSGGASVGDGTQAGAGMTTEQMESMMSGQVPPSNGAGVNAGVGAGVGANTIPNPGMAAVKTSGANFLDKLLQALPLLAQLQGQRAQPDPAQTFMKNFGSSLDMIKSVMMMTEQLKKSLTTDLGVVEKATSVGEKVSKAARSKE